MMIMKTFVFIYHMSDSSLLVMQEKHTHTWNSVIFTHAVTV